MLKKAMLGVLAVALAAGAGNLSAQERRVRAAAPPKEKKMQKGKAAYVRAKGLQSRQQIFDRWLAALTKAYQEDDKQKVGQLIKRMNQLRKRMRAARTGQGEYKQGSQGKAHREKDHEKGAKAKERFGREHWQQGKWGQGEYKRGKEMGRWQLCWVPYGRMSQRGPASGMAPGRWGREFQYKKGGKWDSDFREHKVAKRRHHRNHKKRARNWKDGRIRF